MLILIGIEVVPWQRDLLELSGRRCGQTRVSTLHCWCIVVIHFIVVIIFIFAVVFVLFSSGTMHAHPLSVEAVKESGARS